MNGRDWAEIFSALVIVGWAVKTELQVRNLSNALVRTRQQLVDKNILASVSSLTNSELDILLADELGGGPDSSVDSELFKSGTKREDPNSI